MSRIAERAFAADTLLQEEKTLRVRVINRVLGRSHDRIAHEADAECWCKVRIAASPVSMRMVALIFEHPRYRMFGEINYT